jgi:hypothetical protein
MIKIEVMQACPNPGCQVAVTNTFCESSVSKLHQVTVVAYRILRRFLGFRKTWAPEQECAKNYWLIHAYAKQLQVAIISFVMCVHLHVSERLPREGFLWKLAFVIFTQCCRHSPNLIEVGRKARNTSLRTTRVYNLSPWLAFIPDKTLWVTIWYWRSCLSSSTENGRT